MSEASPLSKSLSMELLASKIPLFRKNKRARDDESEAPVAKKPKVALSQQQEQFSKQEKAYDEQLPEEFRKFRPCGYPFNLPPKDRPIRVYADGVFDLFHLGHMKQLEQSKKLMPNVILVCGIPLDIETHKRKGLTVLSDKDRCETLKHCKWVDEVIPNAPWCVTPEFLAEHKIDYVAHDDLPYALEGTDDIYKPIKEKGMFLTTQRTEGISTSDIIAKIIRDYDKYLMRNFARGATRKELNVSWLKKNELDFKKNIQDFRSYWIKNENNIKNVLKDLYVEIREFLRNKKMDMQQLLSEDSRLPLENFALKYMGNANKDLNLLKWRSKDDVEEDDDDEIMPIKIPEVGTPIKTPKKLPLTPLKARTPAKVSAKSPGKTPVKTPRKTPKKIASTPSRTPAKIATPKLVKKNV